MSATTLLAPGDHSARRAIAERVCPRPTLLRDVVRLCLERFLDEVAVAAPPPDGPVVYVANHQSCFDLLYLAVVLAGARGERSRVLAWDALRFFHYGEILLPLLERPGERAGGLAEHVDVTLIERSSPDATRALFARLAAEDAPRSVVAAGEGRVQLREDQPTEALGTGLLDLAIAIGAPVAPVRIGGGLPAVPDGFRRYWPDRLAAHRIVVGPLIPAETLARRPLSDRRRMTREAIDALRAAPQTVAPEPAALARVDRIMMLTGVTQTKAVLQDLLLSADPETLTEESRAVRDFLIRGWLSPLARGDGWLYRYALTLSDGMTTTDLPFRELYGAGFDDGGAPGRARIAGSAPR